MFLNTDTDLVAQTDLYRVRPYCGFGPKSKKDIEDYFSYKPKSKRTPNDKRVTFVTEQQALWQYVHHHFPESLDPKDVDKIRQDNPDDNFGALLKKTLELGETNLEFMKAAVKATAKKKRTKKKKQKPTSAPSRSTSNASALSSVIKPAVGSWIKILWPGDDKWYPAKVLKHMEGSGETKLVYKDESEEILNLSELQEGKDWIRHLGKSTPVSQSTSRPPVTASAPPTETVPVPEKRQREKDFITSNVPAKKKKISSKKRKRPRTCVHIG